MSVAERDEINQAEFAILRRLLANEQSVEAEGDLHGLVAKRFVRRSEQGWLVTVQGHASYLHELRKSFDREPET